MLPYYPSHLGPEVEPESTALSPTATVRRRNPLPLLGVIEPSSSLARMAYGRCALSQQTTATANSSFHRISRGVFKPFRTTSRCGGIVYVTFRPNTMCTTDTHEQIVSIQEHRRSLEPRKGNTQGCTQQLYILAAQVIPPLLALSLACRRNRRELFASFFFHGRPRGITEGKPYKQPPVEP